MTGEGTMPAQARANPELALRVFSNIKVDAAGCWIWQGSTHPHGYGQIRFHGKLMYLHRLMFAWFVRDLASGEFACHRCNVPGCCNPDHLYAGTQADNMGQASADGRFATGEQHHNAKLDAADVAAIKGRVAAGESLSRVAKDFGVSRATVARAVRGETYSRPITPSRCQHEVHQGRLA